MEQAEEKRRSGRLPCRSAVAWTYFNKAEMHAGQLRNFSSQGACIECPQAPVDGATILLRLDGYPSECRTGCEENTDCPWPRSIVLGDVKWCRGLSGSDAPVFGIGVKFHLTT